MKKMILVMLSLLMIFSVMNAKELLIDGFDSEPADTNYWVYFEDTGVNGAHYQISDNADPEKGWFHLSYPTDNYQVAPAAMQIEYSIHNAESWGGFTKLEHWHPDTLGVYDWSSYDSIAFWYNNTLAASPAGKVHVRLNLHDASDAESDSARTVQEVEYYYSFHYILDSAPGWNQIVIPLISGDYWGGEGFNRTGWSGIEGNDMLDLDAIKGWSIEVSMSGGGEGDICTGTFLLDHLELRGYKGTNFILFNGLSVPGTFSGFTWGQSTVEVVNEAGADGNSNALKWVQGDEWANGWTGVGWNFPSMDLSYEWLLDTLRFKMKNDANFVNIKLQFESSAGKDAYVLDIAQDAEWHDYEIPLKDFTTEEGVFDSSDITVFQLISNGNSIVGNTFYFDQFWTGHPTIDITDPEEVKNLGALAVTGEYYNIITWDDNAGESGETYTVWASKSPITDVSLSTVDLVEEKISGGKESAFHFLINPLEETEIGYYYAIRCTDETGNEGPITVLNTAINNTAKPMPTISLDLPATIVADGDLSEWTASEILPFTLMPSTHNVTLGAFDDDADMTATVYMAVDADNLYIAGYVVDNEFNNTVEGNWWEDDAVEFFIGLYDGRGAKHTSLKRGEEPDMNFYMNSYGFISPTKGSTIYTNNDDNYFFSDLGGSDYVFEVILPLDSLVLEGDTKLSPVNGMRIPIEITIHDKDNAEGDNGNVVLSNLDNDNAWQTPTVWTYTWIGDQDGVTTSVDDDMTNPSVFTLKQNYPNPFNPTTTISFNVPTNDMVSLVVYNILGQEVMTVINQPMVAGTHAVVINAENISSGMYFYTLTTGKLSKTMKMVLIK